MKGEGGYGIMYKVLLKDPEIIKDIMKESPIAHSMIKEFYEVNDWEPLDNEDFLEAWNEIMWETPKITNIKDFRFNVENFIKYLENQSKKKAEKQGENADEGEIEDKKRNKEIERKSSPLNMKFKIYKPYDRQLKNKKQKVKKKEDVEKIMKRNAQNLIFPVTNAIVQIAIKDYGIKKGNQMRIREATNKFIDAIRQIIMNPSDELQEEFSQNVRGIKEITQNMLFPYENFLFHHPEFTIEEISRLPVEQRLKKCKECLTGVKNLVGAYSPLIEKLVTVKQDVNIPKVHLSKAYSELLSAQDNLKKCTQLLQLELMSVVSKRPKALNLTREEKAKTIAMAFNYKKTTDLPLYYLLDLKELAREKKMVEMQKLTNELIYSQKNYINI